MSTHRLRDYQAQSKNDVYAAWHAGHKAVLLTTATGGGKTVLFSTVLEEYDVPAVLIAHRSELLAQSCLALNREGVAHSIVAPKSTINEIIRLEHDTHGYSKFAFRAPVRVAGVDTLVKDNEPWHAQIQLNVIDEGHHALAKNKWGKCNAKFPHARTLGVTAHAVRADGAGLGRHADGIYDALVVGPHGRQLIDRGFLSEYRLLIPPNDIDFSGVEIGSTGDYKAGQVAAATHKSKTIVGNIVQHYLREAGGKLGLTFAVDIEAANDLCAAYRQAGVPADIITGNTHIQARAAIMRQFRERKLLQLVSVDVLGEGTDVPAVEVVSLGRRTASWQLMCQQIGRALRPVVPDNIMAQWSSYTDAERRAYLLSSDKPRALILDHVGNVLHHYKTRGMPDALQVYSLDRAERRASARSDLEPLRSCLSCYRPFERYLSECPYCGEPIPPPASRGSPESVDGNLTELDPEVLAALRGDWLRVDAPVEIPLGMPSAGHKAFVRAHHDRYTAQLAMRKRAALWGGYWLKQGLDDREIQRKFFYTFGIDVLTAQAMSAQDAAQLQEKIDRDLERHNIIEATGAEQ